MTTTPATWTEETIHIAGADLHIKKSGSGDPLLVLHGEMGQQCAPCRDATAVETVAEHLAPGRGPQSPWW